MGIGPYSHVDKDGHFESAYKSFRTVDAQYW